MTARVSAIVGTASLLGCIVGTANSALAQQNSLFGQTQPYNNSSALGTAGMSNGPGAQPPAGFGSAFGGAAGGVRAGNQGTLGAGINAPVTNGPGPGTGAGAIVGRAQGFVGNTASGLQGGAMQQQNRGTQQFNQAGRGGGGNRNRNANNPNQSFNQQSGGFGGNTAQQQQSRQVRPRLRVSLDYTKPTGDKIEQTLNTRFDRLAEQSAQRSSLNKVSVSAESGVITLRGEVATDHERRLVGIMARQEPGVRSVQNELTVANPAAAEDAE